MIHLDLGSVRVDAEGARAYVLAHGGERERTRLSGIFGVSAPPREVVRSLEVLQNRDGGFPAGQAAGQPSAVESTCFVLEQLKEMAPLAGSPMASRAVSFLRRSQQADGSWQESPEVQPLAPPWSRAAEPGSAAYLTALATYAIFTLDASHLDPVVRAAGWLRRALVREGVEPYSQTLALFWAVWLKLHGADSTEATWSFEQLLHRDLQAPVLAWWLSCAHAVGAGGRCLVPLARQIARLSEMQRADGAWPAEAGLDVESTLQALRVLKGYGIL